jgi:hypothetical protein
VLCIASLEAARSQLETIAPEVRVDFLHAWREDLADWQAFCSSVSAVGRTREAMDFLDIKTSIQVGFGASGELTSTHRDGSAFEGVHAAEGAW